MSINADFQWKCQPKAESLILSFLEHCTQENSFIADLQHKLFQHTSTRLLDWVDHIIIEDTPQLEKDLEESGFISENASLNYRVFHHPGAQLPRIVVKDQHSPIGVSVIVDSIADFLMVRGMGGHIEGTPFGGYRYCALCVENEVAFNVVERRGTMTMEPTYENEGYIEKYWEAMEKWQTRPRDLEDETECMKLAIHIAQDIIKMMGVDKAACLILEGERKYWQSRNTAGQIQKNRQDHLGMGWANHDHHTFRSSRKHFTQLVRLFEMLGFHCRERYYTGKEAGWGAQVMENPRARLTLFLDVDLGPHEIDIDFSHHPLPELDHLGTIGLWCALHGDSILKAGMHHLEAQFMFEELTQDLANLGIRMMDPFSNFSYLRQAFTAGEVWHISESHLKRLLEKEKITKEQYDKFHAYGAIGSHLENLQRKEGYKGFNQKNVSVIIQKTDPRIAKI